jgi:hypothetical protein
VRPKLRPTATQLRWKKYPTRLLWYHAKGTLEGQRTDVNGTT